MIHVKKFLFFVFLLDLTQVQAQIKTQIKAGSDLKTIYQQALHSDPLFKKAYADWLVAKQNFPLSLTGNGTPGSGLFPNVLVTGGFNFTQQRQNGPGGHNKQSLSQDGYGVSVTQPIFNYSTWSAIKGARIGVKAATATYFANQQYLIQRVSQAYFEVLRAKEHLRFGNAQQNQYHQDYISAKAKFDVGLIAITAVYDAKARFDKAAADQLQLKQQLQSRLEDLRAITGRSYDRLRGLKSNLPLYNPNPQRVDDWVSQALEANYALQADMYRMLQNREQIKTAATASVPSLNFVGSYSENWAGAIYQSPFSNNAPLTHNQQNVAGLTLSFPALQGGYDITNTKRQRLLYLSSSDQWDYDRRLVERNTRQAYWGLKSSLAQIKADQESIRSARKDLAATRAGYSVGTRTMVDVLNSISALTQAELAYADDRYNYIEGIINLKYQAGTLSPTDLAEINTWLGESLKMGHNAHTY